MKTREFKLGIFIFGALLIITLAVFSIQDYMFFNPGYTIRVKFDFANGIKRASPVRVSGIGVGEIQKTKIVHNNGNTDVIVYAWIQKDVKIPKGSEAFVNSLGVLGEKYLEIIPKQNSKEYLSQGDIITGKSSVPMFKLSEFAEEALQSLKKVLSSIENIVGDEKTVSDLKQSLANLEQTTFQTKELLTDLKTKDGTIGRLIYEDSLHTELKEFIRELKRAPCKLLYVPKDKQ